MTRKQMVIGGVTIAAVLVTALALWPTAVSVEVARIQRDSLTVSVVAEGQTRLRDRFTVAAPVSGRLRRIDLREGRLVTRGEIVARLDPMPDDPRAQATTRAQVAAAEARRQEAVSQLARQETQLAQARREAERRKTLADAGAVSPELREQADLAAATAERLVDAARSSVRAAEADLDAARSALIGADGRRAGATIEVRSPVEGRVLRILEVSERVVPVGSPLLDIGNAAGLEVIVDVLSQDAARIGVGSALFLTDWGGDQVLSGVVRLVEPNAFTKVSALGVEEQRVNVIGEVTDPPASLGVGFRVEARIVTWTGQGVLTVPTSALFRDGDRWQVFRVVDGRARRQPVRIGHRNEVAAEVTEGLEADDQVIVFPSDLVSGGARVRIQPVDPK